MNGPPSIGPLSRHDQRIVAVLLIAALLGLCVHWTREGAFRGGLVEVDGAQRTPAPYQIDLNSAGWPEIAQLPSVGETMARRIVEVRRARGGFHRAEDLLEVPGIGEATLAKLRSHLLPLPGE